MAHAVQHYLQRKSSNRKPTGLGTVLDKLIYVSAIGGPILTVPQVVKIWGDKNASGVSWIYWMGIFVGSIIWCAYGLIHREKPIMLTNFIVIFLAAAILAGTIIYG